MDITYDMISDLLDIFKVASCGCCETKENSTRVKITTKIQGQVDQFVDARVARDLNINISGIELDKESVQRAIIDFREIANILDNNKDESLNLAQKVQVGDIDSAMSIARKIGLTEERLKDRGGGLGFLAFFVAVVIVLVSADSISSESETPPPDPDLDESISSISSKTTNLLKKYHNEND